MAGSGSGRLRPTVGEQGRGDGGGQLFDGVAQTIHCDPLVRAARAVMAASATCAGWITGRPFFTDRGLDLGGDELGVDEAGAQCTDADAELATMAE